MRNILQSTLIALTLLLSQGAFAQDGFDRGKVNEAIAEFQEVDPKINRFFETSYGYAVFPSIGKGAIGIGGAAGKGLVFKNGAVQGGSKMKQVTIGFQFGGKSYGEVIFFENADAYNRFISNEFQFAAQASAVALKSGISADAKYTDGVAVFTLANGGLMYEASIGGQKFKFVPASEL
ncbi:YSC84-related protein [Roseivirga sp. 4D4]|uniref:lipid-binding SYLF domain-containing protein n=1 Tax=Roseivirga sp. 4D4 TaxID=1889784 RepID=UPI0011130104|nr:YSC84-related protein [Roseivirga sp. 4D4]